MLNLKKLLTQGATACLLTFAVTGYPQVAQALGDNNTKIPSNRLQPLPPPQKQLAQAISKQQVEKRIALVIGNADYQEVGKLKNPVNDAQDMAAALKDMGFEVILLTNASLPQMHDAVEQLNAKLRQGGVGLFYYSGHGMQVKGENYLIPVNARIKREQDLQYQTFPVGQVIGAMEDAANRLNIMILDACRDNPYSKGWRTTTRGLAQINAAGGMLIAYATAPGDYAEDGKGRNGTYTAALLKHIKTPNVPVEIMFKRVREDVTQETSSFQIPWESSSLTGDFAFNANAQSQPQPPVVTNPSSTPSPPPQSNTDPKPPTPNPSNPSSPETVENPEKLEQQGIVLVQEAIQLFRSEQYDAALSRAELATQLAPNLYQSWFVLGSLYVQQKKLSEGIEVLQKAQTLAPQEADIFFSLGTAYFQAGDYNRAIKEIKQGLTLKPDELDAVFDLGNCYLKLAQYKEAISYYQKALTMEEKLWPAISNIGLIKYEQGDVKGALAKWDQALAIDNKQAEPLLAKAVALYTQGKKAEGLKLGETALTTDSSYGEIEHLKENLWGVHLLSDAKTFLELPEIKSLIARLKSSQK